MLIRQALAHKNAVGERRQRLLLRRADLESGPSRRKTLLDALNVSASGSTEQAAAMKALLADFIDPALADEAGRLGAEAKNKDTQLELRLRQSELYLLKQNPQAAADVGWQLYESKRLPSDRLDSLFMRLSSAGQTERLIRLAEERLRSGTALNQEQLDSLAAAYEAVGRPDAAKRARTNARDLKPAANPVGPNRFMRGGMGMMSVP